MRLYNYHDNDEGRDPKELRHERDGSNKHVAQNQELEKMAVR